MPVAAPGDTATASREITLDRIEQFAALTGDDNPLHVDAEYAADGVFGGRVAHGILTAGVISAALAELPGDIVYLSQELSFDAPVRPGTTVTCEARVEELIDDDRVRVTTPVDTPDGRVVAGEAVVLSVPHGE